MRFIAKKHTAFPRYIGDIPSKKVCPRVLATPCVSLVADSEVKRTRLFVRHGDAPLRATNKNGSRRARNVPVCCGGNVPFVRRQDASPMVQGDIPPQAGCPLYHFNSATNHNLIVFQQICKILCVDYSVFYYIKGCAIIIYVICKNQGYFVSVSIDKDYRTVVKRRNMVV